MTTPLDRAQARRVFEETLARYQQQYALADDGVIEVWLPDTQGHRVIVARYLLCADGQVHCCEVLDEVLWPTP